MESLPPDHFATSHAYTPHIYRDQYPSIDPSSPLLSLSSKIIIITGASSGIGAQGFAPAFAKARPIAIVLVGRKATKLQATKTAIQPLAPETRILTIAADLTDVASVEKLFAEVKAEVGHADVLVNNAGVFSPSGTLVSVSPTDWWNDFEVNVKGTFLVTQGFLKLLGTERQGSVITMR
jgi:NADP-dependent 3-hydroxy acid dehydrogenase YdfG